MKNLTLLLGTPVLALFLLGCNDEDKVTNVPDNAPVEGTATNTQTDTNDTTTDTQTDDTQTGGATFNFTHFDLDVEYGNNQEYDVDYENETDGMEAEIKDDIGNKVLSGDEAFEVLSPIFEKFTFDQNTANDVVISEVLNAFNLDENYQSLELEVKFTDGTIKEYTKRK
ncbi:YusW-like protein OS=Ureibacillus acetophenoni OX=614649 GN=SAMN05877842_11635 PE=4 SV=1 [Ureibacillus acetophenoni]|uniref:YusW family protein n=1 Tax=Ureibacillus sp. MALMAid1270 TaxID=3411629 RepID=UPI003BA65C87